MKTKQTSTLQKIERALSRAASKAYQVGNPVTIKAYGMQVAYEIWEGGYTVNGIKYTHEDVKRAMFKILEENNV